MNTYSSMAMVYDRLMEDVDYKKWVDYLTKLMEKSGYKDGGILELGCGTGNITLELAKRGYDICGLDISPSMLAVAQEKAMKDDHRVIFFNQSMEKLSLNAKYSCILSPCDGFNYLTNKNDLINTIKRIKKHLIMGGVLIFDISTSFKLSTVLGDNTFTKVEEDICYIWENSYSRKDRKLDMFITFFENNGGSYKRYEEFHTQKAHEIEDIRSILCDQGFTNIKVYGNFSLKPPKDTDQRIHFVCKAK